MFVYLNGRIVEEREAVISPFDHGYLYGLGVFETFPVINGHPFLLDDHLRRMQTSLEEMHIDYFLSREHIESILLSLLEANQLSSAYVRFNISAGVAPLGLSTDPYLKPTILMMMKPLQFSEEVTEKSGVILTVRRNTPEGTLRLKSHHYLNNVLAKREVGSRTDIEGIFLTEKGYVAEGIVSNLFWVKAGVLYTPSLETGILAGITRAFVLEVAQTYQIAVREGRFQVDKLLSADEVFATNSIQEVMAIKDCNGVVFLGKKGPITKLMKDAILLSRESLFSRKEWRLQN